MAPDKPETLIDYSRISVEQELWLRAMIDWIYEPASGRWDVSKTTLPQHRLLEWLLTKCDPVGESAGHKTDCHCYYCTPLFGDFLPDLPSTNNNCA